MATRQPKQEKLSPQQRKVQGAAKQAESRTRRRPVPIEETEDETAATHDFGPWAETPSSSRVESYRYNYATGDTQVKWRNGKTPYEYNNMDYEAFRRFARAASKGKYINSTLNGFPYGPITDDDVSLPSNPKRRGISSRVRG